MKKTAIIFFATVVLACVSGCAFMKVSLAPEIQPLREQAISGQGKDKILLLDITGIITSERSSSGFGSQKEMGMIPLVREQLDLARRDKNIKSVVLRINSPGGGVTASDTLFNELAKFKSDTGVRIAAHIMDTGTSGAYYIALAADRITAQPTSVTGSIGVVMWRVDATGLMQKIGVQADEIVSGDRKGMGSPFRHLSPDEKKIFQEVIDSMHARFVNAVSRERKLSPDKAKQVADGRIFTSHDAKNYGLIDGIGYLDDAVEAVKKGAGLTEAKVVTYLRPGEYKPNIYSVSLINIDLGEISGPGVKFMYIWWP